MPEAKGYNTTAIKQEMKFHRSTGKFKRSDVGSVLDSRLFVGDITCKGGCGERWRHR